MKLINFTLTLTLLLAVTCCHIGQINCQSDDDLDQPDIPQTNCVFVGCSCDGQDEIVILSSNEIEDTSDYARHAKDISYNIFCKDENNGAFKFKSFPQRDNSRIYSHQIDTLDMAGNEVTSIPDDRLKNLEIAIAEFRENKISSISENAFRGVIKVDVLDLTLNQLSDLSPLAFEPLAPTLIQLKINENKLGKMETSKLETVLNSLKKLRTLHIRSNDLTALPKMSNMNSLEELALSYNQIEVLNDKEQLLPSSLIDLNADNNRIKHLTPNTLSNLVNLKYLNLESNQITSIADDTFTHLVKLTQINLAKNYLKQIPPRMFYTLVDLQRLDFSAQNQMLKQIDDYAFDRQSNAREITKIDLSKNRIGHIENKAFCSRNKSHPYVNIREIDLALNPLSNINSCVLRQMAKGYKDAKVGSSSAALNFANLQSVNPKISFKPTHSLEKLNPNLKCDCEIAKASHLIDFEGDCENEQGVAVELKKYKCSSDLSVEEVESSCASLAEFDCLEQKPLEIKETVNPNNSNNNNNNNNNKVTTDQDTFRNGVDINTNKPTQHSNDDNKNRPDPGSNVKQPNTNTRLPVQAVSSASTFNLNKFFMFISTMIISVVVVV